VYASSQWEDVLSRTQNISLAGLRGAQWNEADLPGSLITSVHSLTTADGANVNGFLYRTGGERAVCCIMHPREILATHYLVPELLKAGAAVWVQASRSAGNDTRLEHELALLDVDAGTSFLKGLYEQIVLVGNSGGAGLYAYYIEQANLPPAQRETRTPAGRPVQLADATMVRPDLFVMVAPHPGQGILLMNSLDPSVMDERDPLSIDPALFPFSTANGFKPDGSTYAPAFVANYRDAQRRRVEIIDAKAREMLRIRMSARKASKDGGSDADRLAGGWQHIFEVPRTDADLRNWDLNIDPTDRRVGSLWGTDPFKTNMNGVGFGRVCTPESWLSTWSGLSSRASVLRCAPGISQPTFIIRYTGDACVFPQDVDAIWEKLGTGEKGITAIRGNHHGQPLSAGEPNGQRLAGRAIREWLGGRILT
jgi:hypothetical protein